MRLSKAFLLEPHLLLGKSLHLASPTINRSGSSSHENRGTPSKERDYVGLLQSFLSHHWGTLPPTKIQLRYADSFFSKQPPKFLWSAQKFHAMSFGDSPEICFLGRSNVGKSSLINALFNKRMAYTSSKPGRTRLINAFGVGREDGNGRNRLVVLDMPGYGKGSQLDWGKQILKYLNKRKQLKQAFVLIDTVHGIKSSDEQLLSLLTRRGIPHQIVLTKVDRLLFPTSRIPSESALKSYLADLSRRMEAIKRVIQLDVGDTSSVTGELIACSAEKRIDGTKLGIDSLRHAMLQTVGLECRPTQKPEAAFEIVPHEDIEWGRMPSQD